ncbi:MAG: hypothetical protein HYU99_08225 [Deltaproteobacteria bacterium]|nr:hypothetical protein [Deltaproteobacteria bacterium]
MLSVKSHAVDGELKRAVDLAYNASFGEAETAVNAYISAHPDDPMGYVIRGTALDWKQSVNNLRGKLNDQILADYKGANDMAFQQWNRDQKNIDKMVNLGNTYMYLAKKWLDMGKSSRAGLILKKAKKHMEEAIVQNPNRYDAYLAIGIFNFYTANIPPGLQFIASLLGMTGNEVLGLKYLETAADNPNLLQTDALFVLTHAFGKTKQNYARASTYLDRLKALYPNNPEFPSLKLEYAFRANQFEASRREYQNLLAFCNARAGQLFRGGRLHQGAELPGRQTLCR